MRTAEGVTLHLVCSTMSGIRLGTIPGHGAVSVVAE